MTIARPPQITSLQLARKVIVYLRQSTLFQVENNKGSTMHQRAQVEFAREWGWPEDAIEFETEDLGITGTSGEKRPGWKRLLQRVAREEIGLILAADISRLTRSASDFETLISLCQQADTLIAVNGEILNLHDPTNRLMARFRALFAQYDNEDRVQRLMNAKLALARSGVAVSPAPAGYVKVRQVKDNTLGSQPGEKSCDDH